MSGSQALGHSYRAVGLPRKWWEVRGQRQDMFTALAFVPPWTPVSFLLGCCKGLSSCHTQVSSMGTNLNLGRTVGRT